MGLNKQKPGGTNNPVHFSKTMPNGNKVCPVLSKGKAILQEVDEEEPKDSGIEEEHATALSPKKRKKIAQPLVITEGRRSNRLEGKFNGYENQTCSDRHCFTCSTSPPVISNKVIKSLGADFCKVASNKLTDKALSKKRKSKVAVGAEQGLGKGSSTKAKEGKISDNNNEAKKDKKPKKK